MASSLISWRLYAKSRPLNPPGTELLHLRLRVLGAKCSRIASGLVLGGAVLQPLCEDALSFVFRPSSFPVLRSTKCSWEQAGQNTP